jgi:probable F420-dependent oxidoreductase
MCRIPAKRSSAWEDAPVTDATENRPRLDLGKTGIWSGALRRHEDPAAIEDAAAELEALGYTALWIPGGAGGDDVFPAVERLLRATERVPVATGIVNLWMHTPQEVASAWGEIEAAHPDRFLLGIGISHASMVDAQPGLDYRRPLATTREYLDRLDGCTPVVPDGRRMLAALGPRMMELARERTLGTHPYFSPVAHTAAARAAMGSTGVVAPEIAVVLEPDPVAARAAAREHMGPYLRLPNYTNNLLRHGFEEADLADGGSARLVDAIVAWGDEEAIARRVAEHHAAGADHVCVQVVGVEATALPREVWRRLAPALVG